MRAEVEYFHCGEQLLGTLAPEISEVLSAVDAVAWSPEFTHLIAARSYEHQTGYNRAFVAHFADMGWEAQPVLRTNPRLIGDFRKGLVFVEVQFGNSATLYRDYCNGSSIKHDSRQT